MSGAGPASPHRDKEWLTRELTWETRGKQTSIQMEIIKAGKFLDLFIVQLIDLLIIVTGLVTSTSKPIDHYGGNCNEQCPTPPMLAQLCQTAQLKRNQPSVQLLAQPENLATGQPAKNMTTPNTLAPPHSVHHGSQHRWWHSLGKCYLSAVVPQRMLPQWGIYCRWFHDLSSPLAYTLSRVSCE